MLKALVSFKTNNQTIEAERSIISDIKHLTKYKEMFPTYYPVVKKHFELALNDGDTIVVANNGSWCTTNDDIKIVKYL
jgi:hypothetical protein